MSRNYNLDILKFYFAISIAISHSPFEAHFPVIPGWQIVLLFFILSGFFMVSSFDSGKYPDVWSYSINRISKIYPHYLLAFVIQYLYLNLSCTSSLRSIVLNFFRSLPELFMVSGTGAFYQPLNYPVWHLCCLVVASHILFALLEWNRNTTLNVICPATVLLVFTYLELEDSKIYGMVGNFLYVPMLRAFCGIGLGMFLYDPIQRLLRKMEHSRITALPCIVSVLTVLLFLILWANRLTQALVFPYAGILVCLLYSKSIFTRLFQHPILSRLSSLSMTIYVHHAMIIRLFEGYTHLHADFSCPPDILFLLVLILYCIFMDWIVNLFTIWLKRILSHFSTSEPQSL